MKRHALNVFDAQGLAVLEEVLGSEEATDRDRIAAAALLAKVGLGGGGELSADYVRARLQSTLEAISAAIEEEEQRTALIDMLEEIWS